MVKEFCIACLFLFFSFLTPVLAQPKQYAIANKGLFKRLLQAPTMGAQVNWVSPLVYELIPVAGTPMKNYAQQLLIINHQIYIYFSASGIVYRSQYLTNNADSIHFSRIDSTFNVGYNLECLPFIYNDTLYNLGGYGYWRWNGQLRVFNPKFREWDIVPLNEEISIVASLLAPNTWIDYKHQSITALGYVKGNQAYRDNPAYLVHQVDTVMSLDLVSKNWKTKGILNPLVVEKIKHFKLLANMDSGLLIVGTENVEYWNLLDNKIRVLKNTPYRYQLITRMGGHLIWAEGNKLLFGNPLKLSEVDSIFLKPSDFTETATKIYTANSSNGMYYWLSGISLLMLGSSLYYFKRKPKPTLREVVVSDTPVVTETLSDIKSSYPKLDLFNAIEVSLISLIVKNMKQDSRRTNIEEVNRVLGLSQKSGDMQKRKRSDIIKAINEKYAIATDRHSVVLLNRIKSDLDGRFNELYILNAELPFVEKYIS